MMAEQYRDQLLVRQPPGAALPTDPESTWAKLLHALAEDMALVEARAERLLDESDPRATYELLPDWERNVGLPDSCVPGAQTVEQRRAALIARLALGGNLSRQYLLTAAARLGYAITITEFLPYSVDSDVDEPLYGEDWAFAFRASAPAVTVFYATVDSGVDAPLAWWGNDQLECTMRRHKAAGYTALFAYG
jgi:uncharacterized protein YmfQ (DUF2313 family)